MRTCLLTKQMESGNQYKEHGKKGKRKKRKIPGKNIEDE